MPKAVENIEVGEWVFIIAGVGILLLVLKKGVSNTGGLLSNILGSIGLGATPPASIQSENAKANCLLANCPDYSGVNAKYLATVVPGTGQTVQKLMNAGYTQKQINAMIVSGIGQKYCCHSPNCGVCPEKCPSLNCCPLVYCVSGGCC
jgi:hypothetical protein